MAHTLGGQPADVRTRTVGRVPGTAETPMLTRTRTDAGTGYLEELLHGERVPIGSGSPGYGAALDLFPLVRDWADGDVSFTGGYARGTLLRRGAGADLCLPRNARPGWTVRDHHFDLADVLRARGYAPRPGGVGIQIVHDGVAVDLIPTVTTGPMASDHAVFRHRTGTPVATNLSIHCSYVNTWGYRDEIRLLKLWSRAQALSVPSFLLELVVISAIRRRPPGDLAYNLITVLEHVAERFDVDRIPDPANPAHDVASELPLVERRAVAERARWSLRRARWDDVIR